MLSKMSMDFYSNCLEIDRKGDWCTAAMVGRWSSVLTPASPAAPSPTVNLSALTSSITPAVVAVRAVAIILTGC